MAGYCTLGVYFHSLAACKNMAAHSCNIQPYCLLTHQITYIYIFFLSTQKCSRQSGSRVVDALRW